MNFGQQKKFLSSNKKSFWDRFFGLKKEGKEVATERHSFFKTIKRGTRTYDNGDIEQEKGEFNWRGDLKNGERTYKDGSIETIYDSGNKKKRIYKNKDGSIKQIDYEENGNTMSTVGEHDNDGNLLKGTKTYRIQTMDYDYKHTGKFVPNPEYNPQTDPIFNRDLLESGSKQKMNRFISNSGSNETYIGNFDISNKDTSDHMFENISNTFEKGLQSVEDANKITGIVQSLNDIKVI